jgi:hypothetical protein
MGRQFGIHRRPSTLQRIGRLSFLRPTSSRSSSHHAINQGNPRVPRVPRVGRQWHGWQAAESQNANCDTKAQRTTGFALLRDALAMSRHHAKKMRDAKPEQMPAPSKRFLTLPPLPVACLFMATWESSLFTSQGGAGAVVESRSHKHRSDDRRCAQRRSAPRAHLMSRNATIAAPMIRATRARRRTSAGCSSCRLPVGKDSHRIDAAA